MKMLAYLLAIICAIAAIVYFAMPADSLPSFMPGYDPNLHTIHLKHGIAAAAAAIVFFLIGWFAGRR